MITVTEQSIDTNLGGYVKVGVEPRLHSVKVTWACGDTRTFEAADLPGMIENVELTSVEFGGIPIAANDTNGYRWAASVVDGRFYADNGADRLGEGHSVPWDEFRKALYRALRQVDKRKELTPA